MAGLDEGHDRALISPIHLKSHVHLEVAKGATLLFSDNFMDYLPVVLVRWEGEECYSLSPLIYKSKYGVRIDAYERSPVSGIHLKNCSFMNVKSGNILNHVTDLKVNNVKINGKPVDDRLEKQGG
jgi:polygalacturonase